MPRKKYPLEPLERLRRERADAATRELATAIGVREEAERKRVAAEEERAQRLREAERVRGVERDALTAGELSAGDLQRQGAWQARVAWDDEAAVRGVADLALSEADAQEGEGRARALVATREADVKVVGQHHARWKDGEARALEAAEEEDVAEAWRPRPR